MTDMKILPCLKRCVVFLQFILFAPLAGAQDNDIPSVQELRQQLSTIAQADDISEADKQQIANLYAQAIEQRQLISQYEEEKREYDMALAESSQERERLETELQAYEAPAPSDTLKNEPISVIEENRARARADVAALSARLRQLESTISTERNANLQQEVSTARQLTQDRSNTLEQASGSEQLRSALSVAQNIEREFQLARLSALEQRLATQPARLEILELDERLVTAQLDGATDYLASLNTLLIERQQGDTAALIEKVSALADSLQQAPETLREFAQRNVDFAKQLAEITSKHLSAQKQLNEVRSRLSSLDTKLRSLNRLLELDQFEASAEFGSALRRERDTASDFVVSKVNEIFAERDITESRVSLYNLEENIPPYEAPSKIELESSVLDGTADWSSTIDTLVDDRRRIFSALQRIHTRLADNSSTLLSDLRHLSTQSTNYTDLIESHLFWIPSAAPISLDTVTAMGNAFAWLFTPTHWHDTIRAVIDNFTNRFITLAAATLLLIVLIKARPPLERHLKDMAGSIGKVRIDRFSLTTKGLAITALLAFPPALVLFILALLSMGQIGFVRGLSVALLNGGLMLLLLEFMSQLTRPGGVAEIHFRWSGPTLDLLRQNNRWLMVVLIPIVVVMVLLQEQAVAEIRDGMGRFALIVFCIAFALFAYRLMRISRPVDDPDEKKTWRWYAGRIGYPLLVAVPLALMLISVLGYHYTATQLLAKVVQSVIAITFALITYYTLERGFSVSERRLAFSRIVAKRSEISAKSADRDAAERAGEGVPEVIETHEIDRHTITQQTKTLIRLIVWALVVLLLWLVWRDFLPVARSLDQFVLWQVSSSDSALPVRVVTLWSIIVAASVVAVSIIAIKNLPGALEVALLSRVDLEPGAGYAVTTVVKYLITLVGVIAASKWLGADWSRLQWLIAALGVGLGFGLQEIVANFVSGIIILFERPFRLGDTVTIAGQSGTVSKIRIRATTISDWDRKELIIPNKTFLTQDFVNWTLSDPITRVIIPVGVAYGSEPKRVESLLLEVAHANETLLKDPPPVALFSGFGDNNLNFELRVFARNMVDRVVIAHELHMVIDKTFRENGIEISFPQRDVHLSSASPIEVVLKSDEVATDRQQLPSA